MNNHFVQFKDLNPNTTYYFTIHDSEGISEKFHFSTCSNQNDPLSLIAGGDARDNSTVRVKANKMVAKLKPHVVLFNGDFTGLNTTKQWLEWFRDWEHTIGQNGRITPIIVTRGNHEKSNRVVRKLFNIPNPKIYYNTTFNGNLLNIISLNSEITKGGNQSKFLEECLNNHDTCTWQIPQYHRPVRPHVEHKKENRGEYKYFVPLFEQHENVKLSLENDSHTAKSTWPIIRSNDLGSEDGFMRNDSIGIIYVGEGCWGAPLREANDKKYWTRDCEAVNQFNWIFVSKNKIEVRKVMYENVNEVEDLDLGNRFQMPANISLWTPQNGSLIEIYK
jgi:hypothetical protein